MKYYYHTPDQTNACMTIYSVAHSFKQMGNDLARQAKAFNKTYHYVRVCTRNKLGEYIFYGLYKLEGNKIKRRQS